MNTQAQWRLDFACSISTRLCRFPGIQAIVAGGSVARGYADAYSDLELIAYWNHTPTPDLQQAIITDLQAQFRYPAIDHGHDSALLIRGFPVDLWHKTITAEEAVMDQVLREYSIDLDASNVLDTVRFSIPLCGAELIQPWKACVEAYPQELSLRFLEAYLPHFHLKRLNFAAQRDNPTAFYSSLSAIQSSLFLILLALNRSYFPTFKWLYERLAELPLKPQQIESRLRQMYREPPSDAAIHLRSVLAETLALVETRFPLLDTAFARYGLEQPLPKAYDHVPLS